MIPAAFDYLAPKSLDEALRLLAQHGADAKALAGGHSLIPMMKLRLTGHRYIVDLGRLPELKKLEQRDGLIEIGAMVTHAEIERSGLLRQACPLLAETAAEIGDVQVRNCGTIGGSLAHADPAADYPAAVLALDAEIVVGGPKGTRTVPASDFFIDLMTTALDPSELIIAIRVTPLKNGTGSAYKKVPNPASGFAMVGVAAVVTMKGGTIADARIGVTGIAAKAFRARNAEQRLRGVKPDPGTLGAATEVVTDGITVNGDMHASSEYRAHLARIYARRAVEQAVARARG